MISAKRAKGVAIAVVPLLFVSCSEPVNPPATSSTSPPDAAPASPPDAAPASPPVAAPTSPPDSAPTSRPADSDSATVTAREVLDQVTAAYEAMETYKADGTINSEIDTGGMKVTVETSFSILLKKPNLYLISWNQKSAAMPASQSGAVWSDGTQPYLYMAAMNAYSKISGDELAIGAATGISGGAAFTIPSLFLSAFKELPDPFSRLVEPQIETTEKVDGEECYVIGGPSSVSKREALWVSKSSHLIKKYYRSLEPPEGGVAMPEMTDEQLEEAIRGMGQEVTEETKQKMKEMMEMSKAAIDSASLKGSSTEIHAEISTPDATAIDFRFKPPADSVLKDSLFGGVL